MASTVYQSVLAHSAAKLLIQAESKPAHVRDHLRLVAAELQLEAFNAQPMHRIRAGGWLLLHISKYQNHTKHTGAGTHSKTQHARKYVAGRLSRGASVHGVTGTAAQRD